MTNTETQFGDENEIKTLFLNSIDTQNNSHISVRPTEVLARYDIVEPHIDPESRDKVEEHAVFRGEAQRIPLYDGDLRLEDSLTEIVGLETEHYIKFESPDLTCPLYVKVETNDMSGEVLSKSESIIGSQTEQIYIPKKGDVMGEEIGNVIITDNTLNIPRNPKDNLNLPEKPNQSDEVPGLIERLFSWDSGKYKKKNIDRHTHFYTATPPADLETVYNVDEPREKYDEEMVVTVNIDRENETCTFTEVETGDEYPVELVGGQMGQEMIKFFERVGEDNMDGEFTIHKTPFPRGHALRPSKVSLDTKTWATWLLPYGGPVQLE